MAALAASAAPSPAYALRTVGLEEGSARDQVVQALGGPSISPTTATARAAGQEETIEALVVSFRPSPTGDPILNPAELPDVVRERIVNYLRAEFVAGRRVGIWWKLDLQLALAQRFNHDESAVLTADGSEVLLKHVSRIVPLGRYLEMLQADRIRGRAVKVDFQKNDGTHSVTRATLKAFDPDSEDHGYKFPRPQPGAIWLSYTQDDYKATHGLNDKGDGRNPTVWLPERVPLALVVRIQVGRAPVSGPLGVMPTTGLEESSPYDPSIRDRSARHHPLDLGRRGRHEATEDEARFIRDFIREWMLETGRANRDRTMKSYLRYLVGAHRGRSSQEASAIGLTRIRQRLYVDSFGYLRAFGTASDDGTEHFSLARELLEDAQRALAAGRTDADAVERLTEVLFHEINHVLDVRYGRLASWLRTIQTAWGHSPEKRERWERHIKEMSAIGRTANVMDGVYVPDPKNLAGGAFLYRYRNHNRAVESFATDQFPYYPSEAEFVAVPLDAKGTSKPWAMYRERADQFFARQVSGAAAGMEETVREITKLDAWTWTPPPPGWRGFAGNDPVLHADLMEALLGDRPTTRDDLAQGRIGGGVRRGYPTVPQVTEAFVIPPLRVYYTPESIGTAVQKTISATTLPGFTTNGLKVEPLAANTVPVAYSIILKEMDGIVVDEAALRARHGALIPWTGEQTFAQILQEALSQWLGRPVGRILGVQLLEDGNLAIYL